MKKYFFVFLCLVLNNLYSIQKESLLFYNWAIYSQLGEEGILDEILQRLKIEEGRFIECSFFYDRCYSNTRFLADQGWHGVMLDLNIDFLNAYKHNHLHFRTLPPILCLEEILYFRDLDHSHVQFVKKSISRESIESCDRLLYGYFPEEAIDVLSIDVGGLDYMIFEKLQIRPKVIVVKTGLSWPPHFTSRVSDEVALQGFNQPLLVFIEIGEKLGYRAVCYTGFVFFIRHDLLTPFKEINHDAAHLWMDAREYFSK